MEAPMDIREIRLKLAKVEFQAKSDAAFLERLRDDPLAVLQAEGFDYSTAQEITSQLRDPAALRQRCPPDLCDPLTCVITACCFFTLDQLPPGPHR
jgi:hypothetical protein